MNINSKDADLEARMNEALQQAHRLAAARLHAAGLIDTCTLEFETQAHSGSVSMLMRSAARDKEGSLLPLVQVRLRLRRTGGVTAYWGTEQLSGTGAQVFTGNNRAYAMGQEASAVDEVITAFTKLLVHRTA